MKHKKIIEKLQEKLTRKEIADNLGISAMTLFRWRKADSISANKVNRLQALLEHVHSGNVDLKQADTRQLVDALSKQGWQVSLTRKEK